MATARILGLSALLAAAAWACGVSAPRSLHLRARSRVAATGRSTPEVRSLEWDPGRTAIIVCDMWDAHYCRSAERRAAELAPRINGVLALARSRGLTIIHAPSGTMAFYANAPARRRMIAARLAGPPFLESWRGLDPTREGVWPIDDAVLPCDDPVIDPSPKPATRELPAIEIRDEDGVSDSADEIHAYCVERGIRNLVYVGIHANKCVLGRPFGIRHMIELGMNVVLARDLTDAAYDPRKRPWVSHERGTELVVEHIETFWCPSILSGDLAR